MGPSFSLYINKIGKCHRFSIFVRGGYLLSAVWAVCKSSSCLLAFDWVNVVHFLVGLQEEGGSVDIWVTIQRHPVKNTELAPVSVSTGL